MHIVIVYVYARFAVTYIFNMSILKCFFFYILFSCMVVYLFSSLSG